MLTQKDLMEIVTHALGGASSDCTLPHERIVNIAGQHLYNMHAWRWRERPPVDLHFVSGQSYLDLPIDLGQIRAYALNGLTQDFSFTTVQQIADLRDHSITPTGFHWWGTIVQPSQPHPSMPMPPKRIELFPTPIEANVNDVLTLWYRATWVPLHEPSDAANIPNEAEPLLVELARAFAEGFIEERDRTVSVRVAEVTHGPIATALRQMDSTAQPNYGPLRGGAVRLRQGSDLGYLPYTAPTLS